MKKILIIGPSWVGDAVMAQPLYTLLKQQHPNVEIHVFAPNWTSPLLKRMPEVSGIHPNPFGHGALRLKERWKVARALSKEKFDQVIVLPNSLKSALIPFMAGIPLRTGFLGEMRYGLLNDYRELDEKSLPLMVERFCVLAMNKHDTLSQPLPEPKLSKDLAQAKHLLEKHKIPLDRPLIAMCPGAEYGPAKRWPAHHFAKLSLAFQNMGLSVCLLGSNKDIDIANEIAKHANTNVFNLCGLTTLEDAIDLIGVSALAVCNDSGLMHIAAALDVPLVALYGSSTPDFTPPLTHKAQIAYLNLDCSPCFERVCPLGTTACLENLLPKMILEHAKTLLERYPAKLPL